MYRLFGKPQNYEWGKVGENSLVYQIIKKNNKEVDDSKPYAEYCIFWLVFFKFY